MFLKCSKGETGAMTREDLLQLIVRSLRRSFTFDSEGQARGAADTVLRDLNVVGIRIFAPRSEGGSLEPPSISRCRSGQGLDTCASRNERRD